MHLGNISTKIHPEDIQPNIIVPFAETNGTSAVFDAVKLNLAVQGYVPRLVQLEGDFSYDLLFRQLWAEGQPFIIVEHDILPWPGALQELWTCPKPWCGFPYHVMGEMRSYLGCTKFNPASLGVCPLYGDLTDWALIDKIIERRLLGRQDVVQYRHIHEPGVIHLNINHSRMPGHAQLNPYFWQAEAR